jgi:hypothetical protein
MYVKLNEYIELFEYIILIFTLQAIYVVCYKAIKANTVSNTSNSTIGLTVTIYILETMMTL